MKEVRKFQCEKCGRLYDNEGDAVDCENFHLKAIKVETIYNGEGKHRMPDYVKVYGMSNGSSVWVGYYSLSQEMAVSPWKEKEILDTGNIVTD